MKAMVAAVLTILSFSFSAYALETTNLNISSTPNPGPLSNPVSIGASLYWYSATGQIPTGDCEFVDTSTSTFLGTVPLQVSYDYGFYAGSCGLTTSSLTLGTHVIQATYKGDSRFSQSSASLSQSILVKSVTTLTSTPNPSMLYQSVTLSANVTTNAGSPAGSVQFFDYEGDAIGGAQLDSNGVATLALVLSPGRHSLIAKFYGQGVANSNSPTLLHTVNLPATNVELTTPNQAPEVGHPVLFDAQLTVPSGPVPDCCIQIRKDGELSDNIVGLSPSGHVQATLSFDTLGPHAVTAEFPGTYSTLAPSVSDPVILTVGKSQSVTGLSVSPNPVELGQPLTLNSVVSASPGGSIWRSGTVLFRDGATVLGSAPVTGGQNATLSVMPLALGGHTITAEYSGDTKYLASNTTAPLTVQRSCKDSSVAASVIGGAVGSASGSTLSATAEIGEPNHAGISTPINSVWCRWTAPATGQVTLDTTGSVFDTTLAVYTGSLVSILTPVASNDNLAPGTAQSRVVFKAQQGTAYLIAIDGAGAARGSYVLNWNQAPAAPSVFASVLPTSRSVVTGSTATAFATIVNGGTTTATQCGLSLPAGFPATFSFQATTPANVPFGQPSTPVDIPRGAAQSFLLGITPTSDLNASDIALAFSCANTTPAPTVSGLNTLTLSASATATPDILAIVSTPSNDGIVNVPVSGTGLFAAAAVNIGAAGNVAASVDDGGRNLPLTIRLCRSDPTTGACIAGPPQPAFGTNEVITITVFVSASAPVAFDPGVNRLQLRLKTDDGVTRGSTSVAVRTQ